MGGADRGLVGRSRCPRPGRAAGRTNCKLGPSGLLCLVAPGLLWVSVPPSGARLWSFPYTTKGRWWEEVAIWREGGTLRITSSKTDLDVPSAGLFLPPYRVGVLS